MNSSLVWTWKESWNSKRAIFCAILLFWTIWTSRTTLFLYIIISKRAEFQIFRIWILLVLLSHILDTLVSQNTTRACHEQITGRNIYLLALCGERENRQNGVYGGNFKVLNLIVQDSLKYWDPLIMYLATYRYCILFLELSFRTKSNRTSIK